jgi:hypothetical protein
LGHGIMAGHLEEGRRHVAVFGCGAHGLYQVASAVGLGAESVVYVDDNPDRRDLALRLGAHAVGGPPSRTYGPFDLIVDESADEARLRRATGPRLRRIHRRSRHRSDGRSMRGLSSVRSRLALGDHSKRSITRRKSCDSVVDHPWRAPTGTVQDLPQLPNALRRSS